MPANALVYSQSLPGYLPARGSGSRAAGGAAPSSQAPVCGSQHPGGSRAPSPSPFPFQAEKDSLGSLKGVPTNATNAVSVLFPGQHPTGTSATAAGQALKAHAGTFMLLLLICLRP